jgi:adenylosuccinate lyase
MIQQSSIIEKEIGHEVEAFVRYLNQCFKSGLWHKGLASSDLVECSTAVAIKESTDIINRDVMDLLRQLDKWVGDYLTVVDIGYTHAQEAEPLTWSYRAANWAACISCIPYNPVISGKISGATGTGATIHPDLPEHVMRELGITLARTATQITNRSDLAHRLNYTNTLAQGVQKIANDLRVLFTLDRIHIDKMPVGSSSMPQKVNPYELERIIGMGRMVSHMVACVNESNAENWLERDLTNSVVEREFLPDIFNHTHYCVKLLSGVFSRTTPKTIFKGVPMKAATSIVLADIQAHQSDRLEDRKNAAKITDPTGQVKLPEQMCHRITQACKRRLQGVFGGGAVPENQ